VIVVDASAVVELVLGTPTGVRVAHRLLATKAEPHAPHLLDLEVLQVLRRLEQRRAISRAEARAALDHVSELEVVRHAHDLLVPRIWQLRDNVSAYDAAYVAVAEALDVDLLTCDTRLAATRGHRARIVVA